MGPEVDEDSRGGRLRAEVVWRVPLTDDLPMPLGARRLPVMATEARGGGEEVDGKPARVQALMVAGNLNARGILMDHCLTASGTTYMVRAWSIGPGAKLLCRSQPRSM
jgi:hypothetical protein